MKEKNCIYNIHIIGTDHVILSWYTMVHLGYYVYNPRQPAVNDQTVINRHMIKTKSLGVSKFGLMLNKD